MKLAIVFFLLSACAAQTPPVAGAQAPAITAKLHTGEAFTLEQRRGQWTVLYFYPRDGTPGCTKQACAFRDNISHITDKGAAVYGISRDSVEKHKAFVDEHQLPYPLISDASGDITKAYGVSGVFGMSKRWTFIVDPTLTIREVRQDVDPTMDAKQVAASLSNLQK